MLDNAKFVRYIITILTIIALVFLGLGIFEPMLTVKKMIVVRNTFSIWSGITALLEDNTVILGVILLLFSVLFPVVKLLMILIYAISYPIPSEKLIKYQHLLGKIAKFSMLDVFVIALMFIIVQLGWLVEVVIHQGIYWFSAAVILTIIVEMLVAHDLSRRINVH